MLQHNLEHHQYVHKSPPKQAKNLKHFIALVVCLEKQLDQSLTMNIGMGKGSFGILLLAL